MDEDALNLSLRKFLKKVGINSQRHIEQEIRRAVSEGRSFADGKVPVRMNLRLEGFETDLTVDGEIDVS